MKERKRLIMMWKDYWMYDSPCQGNLWIEKTHPPTEFYYDEDGISGYYFNIDTPSKVKYSLKNDVKILKKCNPDIKFFSVETGKELFKEERIKRKFL